MKHNENVREIVKTVSPEYDPADGHEMTFMDNQNLWIELVHQFTDLVIQLCLEQEVDPLEELLACTVAESLNEYSGKGKNSGDVLFFFTLAQVYIRQLFKEYEKWCESEGERWRNTGVQHGL